MEAVPVLVLVLGDSVGNSGGDGKSVVGMSGCCPSIVEVVEGNDGVDDDGDDVDDGIGAWVNRSW